MNSNTKIAPLENEMDQNFSQLYDQANEDEKYEGVELDGDDYDDEKDVKDPKMIDE